MADTSAPPRCPRCQGPTILDGEGGVCLRCPWGWETVLATEKSVGGAREWRCRGCDKLFALHGYAAGLFLRCPRCKLLNVLGNRAV